MIDRKGMTSMKNDLDDILKDRPMTNEIRIEGVGIVREYGELDLEKLIKRLLQSKGITG
jgi:hypothetical protein